MDICIADPPSLNVDFAQTGDDAHESGDFETVSEDDYLDACEVRADLQELGLGSVSTGAAWRVRLEARGLIDEFRAARSAADLGRPQAVDRLGEASSRLLDAARRALATFAGWTDRDGGRP